MNLINISKPWCIVKICITVFALAGSSIQLQAQETSEPTQIIVPNSVNDDVQVLESEYSENDAVDFTQNENADFNVLSAESWIHRLARVVKEVPFEISFVVAVPGRDTLPYVWRHAVLDSGLEVEQLSLLNGPGFEQIRINNKVSVFEPGHTPVSVKAQVIDGPIPNAFIHNPILLKDGYDVLLMGRNRISGRMAQQIRIISKDKTRYQYHLWLDEQSGLLLKQNMYDLKGNLLEQIQVTQLQLNDNIKTQFMNLQENQLPPVSIAFLQEDQPLPWTVSFLPVGMQVVAKNLRRIPITNQIAEYLMLSDGLVDVSIYVTQAIESGQEDLALTSDSKSIVSISDGRFQVTVIGEIPLETANKLANSIVLVNENE